MTKYGTASMCSVVLSQRLHFLTVSPQDMLQEVQDEIRRRHKNTCEFFTVDRLLQYEAFAFDFGPLNLGKLYRFCQIVNKRLHDPAKTKSHIYLYTSTTEKKRSNAAYLLGSYLVLYHSHTAGEASLKVQRNQTPYLPFRDALTGRSRFDLSVEHCIQGVAAGVKLGFVDFSNFDVDAYEHYEKVENGDISMIIPNKFVHLSGPSDTRRDSDGYPCLTPQDYLPIFREYGVTDVVRLNKNCYSPKTFTSNGLLHHDMYYQDGANPPAEILDRFLRICDEAKGTIAVHCKAGLGRTGTCVGCYMMKRYHLTAEEVIAWLRVCRPGSVLGPQQQFLQKMQPVMWKLALDEAVQSPRSKRGKMQLHFDKDIYGVEMEVDDGDSYVKQGNSKVAQGDWLRHQKSDAQHHHI